MVIKDQARHLTRGSDTAPGIAGDVRFVFHQLAKEVFQLRVINPRKKLNVYNWEGKNLIN